MPLVTRGADRFVRAETFFALARPVARRQIPTRTSSAPTCSSIAPLTANTLAKLAHGLADDVVTEAALAHGGPVLVAPAMNTRMWRNPATQANAATLRARGVELIGPEAGELAEGEVGRRADERAGSDLRARSRSCSARTDALAGTTRRSSAPAARASRSTPCASSATARSGRMGVALAAEARRRGARRDAARREPRRAPPAGVEVVADADGRRSRARGARARGRRRRRGDGRRGRRLPPGRADRGTSAPKDGRAWKLDARADRRRSRRARRAQRNGQVLVGFAAEHGEDGLERPAQKLTRQERRPRRLQRRVRATTSASTRPTTRSTLVAASGERQRRQGAERDGSPPRSSTRSKRLLGRSADGGEQERRSGRSRASARRSRRVADNLARVVHAPARDAAALRALPRRRGAPDHRGLPGRGEDDAGEGAGALARRLTSRASSSRPTCSLRRHRRQRLQPARRTSSSSGPGPVFANVLLVDEINRASPKTQAALLECMQENQVTIDGVSYQLARPFMVIATQNPIEYEGTYPLPEAQLDRFTMRHRARLPAARRTRRGC